MKNIITSLKIAMLFLFVVSCDDYLDVNTDPNNPLEVSANLKLPVALNYTSAILYDARRLNTISNLFMANWSQSDGYSWYQQEFQYNVTSTFYDDIWDLSYSNALKQYNTLDNDTENNEYYVAIAKIMKSYHYQILVDTYGDIPYSESLLRGGNPTPAYDDALSVYEGLISDLDDAINLINTGDNNFNVVTPGTEDGLYSGNMIEWKKFANTIKLRILVRQSSLADRSTYISQELAKINNEGSGFITSDAGLNIGYNNSEDQQSTFWENYKADVAGTILNNHKATCATPYVLDLLTSLNDDRIDYIYELPISGNGHLGVEQGLVEYPLPVGTLGEDNVSNIGPGLLKSAEQDVIFLSLAESYFLQAEAMQRGFLGGDVQTTYEAGVTASFDYLGANIGDYLTQPTALANWNATSNKIEAIITQKYIALNGITTEQSWFDYSRTGFPQGIPISLTAIKDNIPVRLAYPASELTTNSTNVPSQPDVFTSKIFWAN